MSGIIVHTGPIDTVSVLLEGLRLLVHHGHDSAGIALLLAPVVSNAGAHPHLSPH